MSRWTTLSKVDTGVIITQLLADSFEKRWSAIARRVAEEFECSEDDLSCEDDDEGCEFVTLNNRPIVEIHDGYISRTDTRIDILRSYKAYRSMREGAEKFLLAHHNHSNCYEGGLDSLREAAKHLGFELVPVAASERKEAA